MQPRGVALHLLDQSLALQGVRKVCRKLASKDLPQGLEAACVLVARPMGVSSISLTQSIWAILFDQLTEIHGHLYTTKLCKLT